MLFFYIARSSRLSPSFGTVAFLLSTAGSHYHRHATIDQSADWYSDEDGFGLCHPHPLSTSSKEERAFVRWFQGQEPQSTTVETRLTVALEVHNVSSLRAELSGLKATARSKKQQACHCLLRAHPPTHSHTSVQKFMDRVKNLYPTNFLFHGRI